MTTYLVLGVMLAVILAVYTMRIRKQQQGVPPALQQPQKITRLYEGNPQEIGIEFKKSESERSVPARCFYSKLLKADALNQDGQSRQELIAQCALGDFLILNLDEPTATVQVLNSLGEQLGELPKEAAGAVAKNLTKGLAAMAMVNEITNKSATSLNLLIALEQDY